MTFRSFSRLWVVILYIIGCEQWPADKVARLGGLEPLSLLLYQWDSVAAAAVSGSDEYRGAFARDEDVLLIVYGDSLLGED